MHCLNAYNALMSIESLTLFVEVTKLGSFAAVARKLDLDPSIVSRNIAALELKLGIRLFHRSTRHLVITEAGEIYLKRVEPLLEEFEHALEDAQRVSKEPSGTLCMTASGSFGQTCILPHLSEFRLQFPEIKLELLLVDRVVDLVAEGVDLACRLSPEQDAELFGTKLFDTKYHVCVSPDYLLKNTPINKPSDLEKHKCVVFSLPDYRKEWIFQDKNLEVARVKIESDVSISSGLALREAALAGMGPALLADWLIDKDISESKLIPVLTDYQVTAKDFDTSAWLLYPSRSFLPSKTRVMIDFLKSKFSRL